MKTDGNPFFVFEVLRGLKEGRYLTQRADGTWATTRVIDEIRIPASIADMVQARIGEVTDDERNLLEIAACVGFEFDPSLVAAANGTPLLPTLRTFGRIEKTHRLVRSAGRAYRFDHHQVQEHLYAGLHEQVREQLHAAVAEALEARTIAATKDRESLDGAVSLDLCGHFLAGGRGERALRYLEGAQAHLAEAFLHHAAVRLSDRALAVPGLLEGAERARVLLRICGAHGPLHRMGRRARQEEAAREAVALADSAGDDELRALAARALGDVFVTSDRAEEAVASYTRCLEIALARKDRRAEAAAETGLGSACHRLRRLADARGHFERALTISRETSDRAGEAGATVNLGLILLSERRFREAEGELERGIALCRAVGHRQFETIASVNLAEVYRETGRVGAARDLYERQIANAREIGDGQSEAAATSSLGLLHKAQGRTSDARERLDRVRALLCERGDRRGEAICLHNIGDALRDQGDEAAAREHLLTAVAICEETHFWHLAAVSLLALGDLELAAGHDRIAREHLSRALDLAPEQGQAGTEVLARAFLARLPGGDLGAAERSYAANETRLTQGERCHALWLLWKAGADRARLAEAKRLLDESVSHLSAEDREAALANVHLHREIVAATRAAGA